MIVSKRVSIAAALAIAVGFAGVAAHADFPVSTGGAAAPATAPAPVAPPAPSTAPAAPVDGTVDPNKTLSMIELQIAFQNKQYRPVLQQIAKIQNSRALLANYNPYDLTMMKAETMLRLHMMTDALAAYALALKQAPDANSAAIAAATALLVKRSTNLQYTLKHPLQTGAAGLPEVTLSKQVFDLTDSTQRPDALTALYMDERAVAAPKITAAEQSSSLPPIATGVTALESLRQLEIAATGKDAYVKLEMTTLATLSKRLIKSALTLMADQVADIKTIANTTVEQDIPIYNSTGQVVATQRYLQTHGLTATDSQNLRNIKANADMIEPAARELAQHLQLDPTEFDGMIADAHKLSLDANNVLTTNYSALNPPGMPGTVVIPR